MTKQYALSDLRNRLQLLSLREQLLGLVVLAAAIYFLFDALVFNPQKLRQEELQNQQTALQAQILGLKTELAMVERTQTDQFVQKEREFRQLQQQVAQLDALSGSVNEQAPAVDKLVSALLAASSPGVRTVGVKTVAAKPVPLAAKVAAAGQAPGNKAPQAQVYKHGVEMELRGNYLDIMKLLARLEDANPKLFWSSAVLSAGTHPENTLRASVFLLSKQANL